MIRLPIDSAFGAPARPRNGCVPFAPGAEAPVSGPPSAADAHTR